VAPEQRAVQPPSLRAAACDDDHPLAIPNFLRRASNDGFGSDNDDSRKQSLGDDSTSRNFHSGCQCAFPMWLMNWEQAADDRSAVADKTDTAK
jgi:hypothetical protein